MKRLMFLVILLLVSNLMLANDEDKGIAALGIIYRNFVFGNIPSETELSKVQAIGAPELSKTKQFITQCISPYNDLASDEFLTLPDNETLLQLYLIMKVNANVRKKEPADNMELINEWRTKGVPRYELVENYYGMLFTGIGNKNQPFDFRGINFVPDQYDLKDETEKGIFFLTAINLCYYQIWGYMNVADPPNYKKVLASIERYPTFNGQEYFKYKYLGFQDFEMKIQEGKGKESYKHFYINRFFKTLIYHHQCLRRKRKTRKAAESLAINSILREQNYYEFSQDQDYLNGLFRRIKMD